MRIPIIRRSFTLSRLIALLVLLPVLLVFACNAPPNTPAPAASVAPPEPADPSVSLMSLSIHSADYTTVLRKFSSDRDALRSRDRDYPAQTLTFHVATEKHPIITAGRVSITDYRDNLGNDLSIGASQTASRIFFPAETNISLDRRHAFIQVTFSEPPSPGATSITLRGKVLLTCGVGEKTLEFKNLPFQRGSSFTVNGQTFTLSNTYSYDSHPEETNFTFDSEGPYENIRAIRFLSADGKNEIAHIWRVDRNMREPLQLLCSTSEHPAAITVQVDTYDHPESLSVPFDLQVSVGSVAGASTSVIASATPAGRTTANAPATAPSTAPAAICNVLSLGLEGQITKAQASAWFGERESVSAFRKAGTSILVRMQVPNQRIVQATGNSLSISTFQDDHGTDLLSKSAIISATRIASSDQSPVSSDGHETLFQITSAEVPAAGTSNIYFNGKVTLKLAGAPATAETKNVSLTPGETVKIGDRNFKITSANVANAGMNLMLTSDDPLEGIKSFTFLDADGKILASTPTEKIRSDRGYRSPDEPIRLYFSLPRVIDTATIRIETFEPGPTITVPLNLKIPIGL